MMGLSWCSYHHWELYRPWDSISTTIGAYIWFRLHDFTGVGHLLTKLLFFLLVGMLVWSTNQVASFLHRIVQKGVCLRWRKYVLVPRRCGITFCQSPVFDQLSRGCSSWKTISKGNQWFGFPTI